MPGQLNSVDFGLGNTITVSLSSFTVKLPSLLTLSKINDHTVLATINVAPLLPKFVPAIIGALFGTRTISWDLDTGSINVR